MIKRVSTILLSAALLGITMISSAAPYNFLHKSNDLPPTIYLEIDRIGDRIDATIWLENVEAIGFNMDINFNPAVVRLIDTNGNPVISRTKTDVMINGGLAGLTPGQALGNGANPQFWNGWFFVNDQLPYADNLNGVYRLDFQNSAVGSIERESLVTLHFEVIGAGDYGIRFGDDRPPMYFGAASSGILRVPGPPRLAVLDSDGNEVTEDNITQLASQEEVRAVFFDRPSELAGTRLILAVFDNRRFYDFCISETHQTASVRLPTDIQNATIKVFVWDDFRNINPAFEPLMIGGKSK